VVVGASEKSGVFARNVRLIVVTVESPGLELAAAECTFVHELVERMLVVVTLFADGVESGDEVLFGE